MVAILQHASSFSKADSAPLRRRNNAVQEGGAALTDNQQ
jgi:hypothetical protein